VRTDFNKCHNLSNRNVKVILKILSDLKPLRNSSNEKTLYCVIVCVIGPFFHKWAIFKRESNERFKGPRVPKTAKFTHELIK
jgi:hypothetical protein